MGKSLRTRVVVGVAAVALLMSVLVGVAANVSLGSALTTSSITWCRSCV